MSEVTTPYRYSYTALSTHKTCPMQFFLKYVARRRVLEQTLALEFGNIAHKVKELISLDLMNNKKPDYDLYESILLGGYTGADKSTGETETLAGCKELEQKYHNEWWVPDNKSDLTYAQKVNKIIASLRDEEYDPYWRTIGAEVPFEVTYNDIILFGLIDKIQQSKSGELRIVDYKTSKKLFSDEDIRTPLQMLVYHIAVNNLYPEQKISEYLYDFIAIDRKQIGGTPGWINRGKKKLDAILASIAQSRETDEWQPKPSPLCHWCQYCRTNPNADPSLKNLCPYYSLWRPNIKIYEVASHWIPGQKATQILRAADAKANFWW